MSKWFPRSKSKKAGVQIIKEVRKRREAGIEITREEMKKIEKDLIKRNDN